MPQRAADRREPGKGRVVALRKQEGNAQIGQRCFGQFARAHQIEPQRLQRVRAARQTGSRAVAVFGHWHPASCNYQSHCGRDVQAVLPVPPGAAHINCAGRGGDRPHSRAHCQHCASDFFLGFAAPGQFSQGGGDDFIRQLAIQHRAEQRLSLGQRQAHASALTGILQTRKKVANIA